MSHNNVPFKEQCYALLRQIPAGRVTTYAEMARAMGSRAWRAVGTAMARNPDLFDTPCHRVVRSDGSVGQYALGPDTKAQLLAHEGVEIANGRVSDLGRHLFRFNA